MELITPTDYSCEDLPGEKHYILHLFSGEEYLMQVSCPTFAEANHQAVEFVQTPHRPGSEPKVVLDSYEIHYRLEYTPVVAARA